MTVVAAGAAAAQIGSDNSSEGRPGTPSLGSQTTSASSTAEVKINKQEVRTILPLFLGSDEARQLAAALEFSLRQGDLEAGKLLLERYTQATQSYVESSTFAILAADWLADPTLLQMLHESGVLGTSDDLDRQERTAAAASQVAELQNALEQERQRAQTAAREKAEVSDKLAALQASQERSAQERTAAAASQVAELQNALEQERHRAQTAAREKAEVSDKLAALQAGQERSATAAKPSSGSSELSDRSPQSLPPQVREPKLGQAVPVLPFQPDFAILIRRAEEQLKRNDISGARLLLQRPAREGNARAIYLLAETFDPKALARKGVFSQLADPARAHELYKQAQAAEDSSRRGGADVTKQ